MSLALSQKSTFSFNGSTYYVTSVSVDAPQPEIVDMTSATDGASTIKLVPTGAYTSPGKVSVEAFGFGNPKSIVGTEGSATFTTQAGSLSVQAICESASVEAQVGQMLRIRFSLVVKES
jgi:hypothetical protein